MEKMYEMQYVSLNILIFFFMHAHWVISVVETIRLVPTSAIWSMLVPTPGRGLVIWWPVPMRAVTTVVGISARIFVRILLSFC